MTISRRRELPLKTAHESFWLNASPQGFTALCLARLPLMADSKGAKLVNQMQHDDAVGYADAQEKKGGRWGKGRAA